jgi:hypothetical protein
MRCWKRSPATPPRSSPTSRRSELTDNGRIGRLWPVGDANALADALFDAWARRACAGEVREHFDATLSFPALGRRWAEAYGQLVESQRRPPP